MKVNWKLRLQNKVTLVTLLAAVIGFVYLVLDMFGVVPSISEDSVKQTVGMFIDILCMLGIVVDPTTSGVSDSERALTYDSPAED